MGYIVRGKYVLTDPFKKEQGILKDAGVYCQDRHIVAIDSYPVLHKKFPAAEILGDENDLVMPGLIDAHTHGHGLSHIQRGIPFDFLENSLLDWAFACDLPPGLNAQLTAVRHLKNGCTMLHHNEMGKVNDPQALAKAISFIEGYQKTGIRTAYSPGIRDINFLANDDEAFFKTLPKDLQDFAKPLVFFDKKHAQDEYLALFEQLYAEYHSEKTRIFFGPNWAHGTTDTLYERIRERSAELGGLPVHIHTLQTPYQKAYGIRKYGKSLLAHLDDLGLVNEHLVLGHAVYVNESDISLLAAKEASVTHHPTCNLAMRNGIAPVYAMHMAGVHVALGIDEKGFNDDEDPFTELRMIHYLHRVSGFDLQTTPAISPYDILAMGTTNAARVLGVGHLVGRLKPGMLADLIVLDTKEMMCEPWISPRLDIAAMLIHRARGSQVKHVIVDGNCLIKNGNFQTIDVNGLYEEVRQIAAKEIPAEQLAYAEKLRAIKPFYQKWYSGWLDTSGTPFYLMNARR